MPRKHFIWDPVTSAYLMEQDGHGDTTAVYHTEPVPYGRLISQRRDGQTLYHHYDALGSTRVLTNSAQQVVSTNLYDAWGVNVASTGTTENPFRWLGAVGYYFDAPTGDYYVRARNYSTRIGRWLSVDPLLFVDGSNLYSAQFIPQHSDPSGAFLYLACCELQTTCYTCYLTSYTVFDRITTACDSRHTRDNNPDAQECCERRKQSRNRSSGIGWCDPWFVVGGALGACGSGRTIRCEPELTTYFRELSKDPGSALTRLACLDLCKCVFPGRTLGWIVKECFDVYSGNHP